jgi:hypothetical protein
MRPPSSPLARWPSAPDSARRREDREVAVAAGGSLRRRIGGRRDGGRGGPLGFPHRRDSCMVDDLEQDKFATSRPVRTGR